MKFTFYRMGDGIRWGWNLESPCRVVAGDMHQGYERLGGMIRALKSIYGGCPKRAAELSKEIAVHTDPPKRH